MNPVWIVFLVPFALYVGTVLERVYHMVLTSKREVVAATVVTFGLMAVLIGLSCYAVWNK